MPLIPRRFVLETMDEDALVSRWRLITKFFQASTIARRKVNITSSLEDADGI